MSISACEIYFALENVTLLWCVVDICSGVSCLNWRDERERRFRQRQHLVDRMDRRRGSLLWSLLFVTALLRAFLGHIFIFFHILSIAVENCRFLEAVCLSIGALKRVIHLKGLMPYTKYFQNQFKLFTLWDVFITYSYSEYKQKRSWLIILTMGKVKQRNRVQQSTVQLAWFWKYSNSFFAHRDLKKRVC